MQSHQQGLCLTRFLIVGSWDFSNFRFLHRCTSSDFLLRMESTGAFLECSSDFLLGVSSQSPFRLAASGTSLLSLLIFCSFSSEPGRFDAYLNPGPRFCLYARETQNTNPTLYLMHLPALHSATSIPKLLRWSLFNSKLLVRS